MNQKQVASNFPAAGFKVGQCNDPQQGIAKFVLSLVKLVTEVLEKQAMRRFDAGSLSSQQADTLGTAFYQIDNKLKEISGAFGLKSPEQLELNFNTLSLPGQNNTTLQASSSSLADIIDRIVDRGAVVAGNVSICVADVELLTINLLASLSPMPGNKPSRNVGESPQ